MFCHFFCILVCCFVWVFVYVLLLFWYASSSIELFGCDSFCYNYITNGKQNVKGKGIPRAYIKKYLNYKLYLENIMSGSRILAYFTKIHSKKHVVTTALISIKVLWALDTKRYFSQILAKCH